jgi:hypothetical protein
MQAGTALEHAEQGRKDRDDDSFHDRGLYEAVAIKSKKSVSTKFLVGTTCNNR